MKKRQKKFFVKSQPSKKNRHLKTIILIVCIVIAVVVVFVSRRGIVPTQAVASPVDEKVMLKMGNDLAMTKLGLAMLSHPEPLVREKLHGWMQDGTVTFIGNNFLPTLNSSFEQVGGTGRVALWFNIPFVLGMPDAGSAEDKKILLWLIIYHEAVHIDDHISSRIRLLPLIPKGQVSKESEEIVARTMLWDMEWSAVSKEWALAKKLQKPYLVPVINHYTRNSETLRNFLDGFYQLQITGEAVKLNPALLAGFTSRYKQELVRLPDL